MMTSWLPGLGCSISCVFIINSSTSLTRLSVFCGVEVGGELSCGGLVGGGMVGGGMVGGGMVGGGMVGGGMVGDGAIVGRAVLS